MTPNLGADDAARVLAASHELWPPGPDFRTRAADMLRHLIPCEVVTFNRLDLDAGEVDFIVSPSELQEGVRDRRGRVDRVMENHPIVEYYLQTGTSLPMRVSDTVPLEEWHDSVLFREHLEPNGLRWTMIQFIPTADHCINSVSLFAAGEQDFTARDQAVLGVLTPMLALGCGGAPAPGGGSGQAGLAGWAMLSIDDAGKVVSIAPDDSLVDLVEGISFDPAAMRSVRGARYGEPLVVELNGHAWQLQPLGRRDDALVAFVRPADERDAVRRLSERQLEVLEQVALGHTNGRIARELGIAEGTARKHVEQLLAQLGAGNRAEAVAIWHRSRSATR